MSNYVQLSLQQAAEVTLDAWEADPRSAPLWLGPPGIGKTQVLSALAGPAAQVIGPQLIAKGHPDPRADKSAPFPAFDFAPLEIAHGAEEDIGGIPVRDAVSGAVIRLPIGPLRRSSDHPTINLYDEVSRAKAQKQGAVLTLVNERRAGDFALHPGSRNVLAANGVESSGTHSIIDALLNRCLVIEIHADLNEFLQGYLMSQLGDPGSTLRELAVDYAMTAIKAPGLVELTPPPNATESGLQWASPRAIEKGLRAFDTSLKNRRIGDVLIAALAGNIGKEAAAKYLSIRKVREKLPTAEQIVNAPDTAIIPDANDIEANVGVVGLLGVAATKNLDAAWEYHSRLGSKENAQALTRALAGFGRPKTPKGNMLKMAALGRVGLATEA